MLCGVWSTFAFGCETKYISVEGNVSVLNSNEDTLKIKQGDTVVVLYRVTGKDAKTGKDTSSFLPPVTVVPVVLPTPLAK